MIPQEEPRKKVQELSRRLVRVHGELFAAATEFGERREGRYREEVARVRDAMSSRKQTEAFNLLRKEQRLFRRARDTARQLLERNTCEYFRVAEFVNIGFWRMSGSKAPDGRVPFVVPLLGQGSVAVIDLSSGDDDGQLAGVVRAIELEACKSSFLPQLEIDILDPKLKNREAPLAALDAAIGNRVARYIEGSRGLEDLITTLVEHMRHMMGVLAPADMNAVDYQVYLGRPVEPFYLVVLHDYPTGVDEAQHRRLLALAREGKTSGISIVFALTNQREYPRWFKCDELLQAVPSLHITENATATWSLLPSIPIAVDGVSVQRMTSEIDELIRLGVSRSVPPVSLDEVLPKTYWSMTSEDGLIVPIGLMGALVYEVPIGSAEKQLHNILVTGAVGQGKSNLLKSIIYSLAAQYSPDELVMYLLDFKEGVTLYPLAPSKEDPVYLPHARVLGLDADQDFGIEVLRELLRELVRRAELMKPYGDNILKYRSHNLDEILPRIVLVIDEFQMLLDGAQGSEAAALLERLVRKGRSYGIHVILASQSIGGIPSLLSRSEQLFAQFPVRIGLKNSPSEARATFGLKNEVAAHLRLPGQAVLNCNYGDIKDNQIVQTPLADDEGLGHILNRLYSLDSCRHEPPCVFDGTHLPDFNDDYAKRFPDGMPERTILLGRSPSLRQPYAVVRLDSVPGRNVALVGRGRPSDAFDDQIGDDLVFGTLAAVARSLSLASCGCNALFEVIDMREKKDGLCIEHEILACNEKARIRCSSVLPNWIMGSDSNANKPEHAGEDRFVFLLGLDRMGSFDFRTQGLVAEAIRNAPTWGAHCICWWLNPALFSSQLGSSGQSAFDITLAFFGTGSWARSVHGPGIQWDGRDNRMLYADTASSSVPQKLLPYKHPIDDASSGDAA